MKHHAPRKRATAKSRARERNPLSSLRNPKPHEPAPWAPRMEDDEPTGDVRPSPDVPDYWVDEGEFAGGPLAKPSYAIWYWAGAVVIAALALGWWWL